jgi:hypothetical protein
MTGLRKGGSWPLSFHRPLHDRSQFHPSPNSGTVRKKDLDAVHSGEKLEWSSIQPGLTYKSPDAQAVRRFAREHGLVPEIQMAPAPNNKQYANFSEYALHTVEINDAGVFVNGVKQRTALDRSAAEFYKANDDIQFPRLSTSPGMRRMFHAPHLPV